MPGVMARRGSGSNKTRRKQREYQRHVRAMLGMGKVNDARGQWVDMSILDSKVQRRAEKIAERMAKQ